MFFCTLEWLTLIIPVLINVAFFTLMERNILGLSQSRNGPNNVSFGGLLQPFADAVNLFINELTIPSNSSHNNIFAFSPFLALALTLLIWGVLPSGSSSTWEFSYILLLIILSLGLYPLLLAGWSSSSNYAIIGAIRGVAQTISYEISLALILLAFIIISQSVSWSELTNPNPNFSLLWVASPLLLIWIICCVAETNRTPFDFAEGESELVSGFNVEYSGGTFALIFIAEYSSILILSAFSSLLLYTSNFNLFSALITVFLAYFWVWLRATLPRYRYDKLISLAWNSFLPLSLACLIIFS